MAFPDDDLPQKAVYFGNPTDDGHGGFTYDDPVEIPCRWFQKSALTEDNKGQTFSDMAQVQVNQDVDINGLLFLGDLTDLDSSEEADPTTKEDIWTIKRFEKVKELDGPGFYREAFLKWQV